MCTINPISRQLAKAIGLAELWIALERVNSNGTGDAMADAKILALFGQWREVPIQRVLQVRKQLADLRSSQIRNANAEFKARIENEEREAINAAKDQAAKIRLASQYAAQLAEPSSSYAVLAELCGS